MMRKVECYWNQILNKFLKDETTSEETKIIYVYRYLSWALTSIVYLTGGPYSIVLFKLGVIISLFILSKIINNIYIKFKEHKGFIRTLVLIETLGITLLLLPTGGLNSPFVWYALNPTLIAACYLPAYFCWINLLFYLFAGTSMSYIFFNTENITVIGMLINNKVLILVLILITLAVQLLGSLARKLFLLNETLGLSNKEKQESIKHIMNLYQIIEALNNHSNKEKLIEILAKYTSELTKSPHSFIWLPSSNNTKDLFKSNIELNTIYEMEITSRLKDLKLNETIEFNEIRISNKDFYIIPILSISTCFGIIGIEKDNHNTFLGVEQSLSNLKFLSELSAVTLERFKLEDIEDHLLIMEEQNRIANEIHDSVSQRLFSISYATHGMLGRWKNMTKDELKKYINEIRESSNSAMEELRNSIYKLSSKKKGERSLKVTLTSFLCSIETLHKVTIDFDISGDESLMSLPFKKGIVRIIREACINAVRHGNCTHVHLDLNIDKKIINLVIADNGKGFIENIEFKEQEKGIGLSNMKNIVNSFKGDFQIISTLGDGTEIHVTIPTNEFSSTQQGGLAI